MELFPLNTSSYDPGQEEHHTQDRGLHCQQRGHPKSHWSALGPLLLLAEDQKTDLSHVATAHLIRLIIIVTIFPFFVNSYYDVEIENFIHIFGKKREGIKYAIVMKNRTIVDLLNLGMENVMLKHQLQVDLVG